MVALEVLAQEPAAVQVRAAVMVRAAPVSALAVWEPPAARVRAARAVPVLALALAISAPAAHQAVI